MITAANENLEEGMEPLTRDAFESDKRMFRYLELTKDARLDAVELAILEMV